MDKRTAVILRASSLWAIWVWAVLVRNMVKDRSHPMSFRLVHIVLAAISLAFAAETLKIAHDSRATARS